MLRLIMLAILLLPILLLIMIKVNIWVALLTLIAAFFLDWKDHNTIRFDENEPDHLD